MTTNAISASGRLFLVAACFAGVSATAAQESAAADAPEAPVWDARAAEHLINRASFGARPAEIARAVERGHTAFVEALLAGATSDDDPYFAEWHSLQGGDRDMRGISREERQQLQRQMRRKDRDQLGDFVAWWVERMVAGEDPLRERMTLFWHGHFTSSYQDVRNSYEMIQQNQFLRDNALGSFSDLLRGIARDPAMLEYLDNGSNRKGRPNENFARELLELFTLGEGNYTEQDIKEAARAFTGWFDRGGKFLFNARRHDPGEKIVLGRSGTLHGSDVIEVILEQDACGQWIAGKIIAYFEGVEPAEERRAEYGAFLRDNDYEITPFLRKLFLDPRFYRDEVVGTRIAGPVDYLVGSARRIGIAPPARFLFVGAGILGQRLFFPPNVKGWEGGKAWVDTARFMQRGNLAGVMLGVITVEDVINYSPLDDPLLAADGTMTEETMEGDAQTDAPAMESDVAMEESDAAPKTDARPARPTNAQLGQLAELRRFRDLRLRPRFNLSARLRRQDQASDEEIVCALASELLAVEVGAQAQAELVAFLGVGREELGVDDGKLLEARDGEELLRRLAHLMLSLPEAQLN